eukprot:COSAG05_NODE_1479_length_4770_cov_4.525583_8_plen_253_part_00
MSVSSLLLPASYDAGCCGRCCSKQVVKTQLAGLHAQIDQIVTEADAVIADNAAAVTAVMVGGEGHHQRQWKRSIARADERCELQTVLALYALYMHVVCRCTRAVAATYGCVLLPRGLQRIRANADCSRGWVVLSTYYAYAYYLSARRERAKKLEVRLPAVKALAKVIVPESSAQEASLGLVPKRLGAIEETLAKLTLQHKVRVMPHACAQRDACTANQLMTCTCMCCSNSFLFSYLLVCVMCAERNIDRLPK